VVEALAGLDDGGASGELLETLRLVRFEPLGPGELDPVRRAFAAAGPTAP